MASKAIDFTTIAHALGEIGGVTGVTRWLPATEAQAKFLMWFGKHHDEIAKLTNITAKASPDYMVLNEYLTEKGFDIKLDPFDGIGVVSILDMLVEWLVKGKLTTIENWDEDTTYPAFEISADGVELYMVEGHVLARLLTKSGQDLWLTKWREPDSELDLALTAQHLMDAPRHRLTGRWQGVQVPMLEMDISPDLSWLPGIHSSPPTNWTVAQVLQQFKLRANERGAHIKVAAAVVVTRSASSKPVPYVFDEPFIGFFTQPEGRVPLAAFYADTDVWENSGGTIEDL